jgi:TPR repeat protein
MSILPETAMRLNWSIYPAFAKIRLAFSAKEINIMSMKHLFIALLLPLFLLGCSSNKAKQSPLAKAESAYEAGEYEKAAAELLPLAKKGDPHAQYTLGYMYYYGQGVKRDRSQGYFWMQQSAKQGNQSALKALELLNQDNRKGVSAKPGELPPAE